MIDIKIYQFSTEAKHTLTEFNKIVRMLCFVIQSSTFAQKRTFFSIKATTQKNAMPVSAAAMTALNIFAVSKWYELIKIIKPIPLFDPINSPTMAPITARDVEIFKAEKIYGSAVGRRTNYLYGQKTG